MSTTFQQLQQIRGFYRFPDPLDIDRYTIDGEKRDVVVAVREVDLAGVPQGQRNWINDHAVYTHGFGFVSAFGNTRTSEGEPDFNVSDIPPQGDIGEFEPRVYFGERSPTYSIVGAPEGRGRRSSTSLTRAAPGRPTAPTRARAASPSARCSTGCCTR